MNPYFNPSLLSRSISILKSIKWGAILDGTQKTLGVVNQAIPIVYQVKPMLNNAKTLFKIANAITEPNEEEKTPREEKTTSPIFYL